MFVFGGWPWTKRHLERLSEQIRGSMTAEQCMRIERLARETVASRALEALIGESEVLTISDVLASDSEGTPPGAGSDAGAAARA